MAYEKTSCFSGVAHFEVYLARIPDEEWAGEAAGVEPYNITYLMAIKRNRILYLFLIISTIALGLASRAAFIPEFIYPYLGDVFYALMIFWMTGLLFPRISSEKAALISILFCFLIEFSQLYQAEWINEIKRIRLGGLILGFGFLWSDLASYVVGGMIGLGLEYIGKDRGNCLG